MRKMPSLGEQEMELLQYIDRHAPASVRDVAQHFEREKKLARTTVLTVMERLRQKGFLARVKIDGIFKYSPKFQADAVMSSKISDFVEKTLGGSISPLFAYFSSSKLTKDEVEELKRLAAKLEKKSGE